MPAPPVLLVTIMNRLIPPPWREAVLGDLWEQYRSPGQFLRQGLAVLPFLILSQVRRRSSWPILGLQVFILFACLRGFQSGEAIPPPWMRAFLPALFAFLALAGHDTYRTWRDDPAPRPVWGDIAAVTIGIGLSQLLTALIVAVAALQPAWLLTWRELLFASSALPVLCLLRWGASAPPIRQAGRNEDLVADYRQFHSAVRWRNRLEISAIAATLLISAALLLRAEGPVSPLVWVTLCGFAALFAYLIGRGGAAAPDLAASRETFRRRFCDELIRQHKLRSMLLWWWLTPLLLGLVMHFFLVNSSGPLLARQLTGVVLIGALVSCILGFNAERGVMVRRHVRALSPAPTVADARPA